MAKPILILIHGLKRKNEQTFQAFKEYVKKHYATSFENIIDFEYYDNSDKTTINAKDFEHKIYDVLNQYRDDEVYLLGYSMGGVAALTLSQEFSNITKIFTLVPVFKIKVLDWPKKIINNLKKQRVLKKKLGKERYLRLKKLQQQGISEQYPVRVISQINRFRRRNKKHLVKLENRKLGIIFSTNDEINNLRATIAFINDKINYIKNDLFIMFVKETHFELLDAKHTQTFEKIVSFFIEEDSKN